MSPQSSVTSSCLLTASLVLGLLLPTSVWAPSAFSDELLLFTIFLFEDWHVAPKLGTFLICEVLTSRKKRKNKNTWTLLRGYKGLSFCPALAGRYLPKYI